ncbi:phospho-N-acetylmuramoyl-pentapeptide-transferase [Myxococcota bacterium]|nr:phospho-N-acetylmuramoyl-pentapeptide-transferase [Myxococcota bacterium]
MLYHLLVELRSSSILFNVFRYISFRTAAAMITALLIAWLVYPPFIRLLQRIRVGQMVRTDGPETHKVKQGTPTMGGLVILAATVLSTLLWARLDNPLVWGTLAIAVAFGAVGFMDDYQKVTRKDTRGVSGKARLAIEAVATAAVMGVLVYRYALSTVVAVPFLKDVGLDLGAPGYVVFSTLVIVGCANAVNLTDGLDGLAIGPVMTSAMTFAVLAYLAGNFKYAEYLQIPPVAGAGELTVLAVTIVGAGLGFLWYNTFPASIFMGDTGSLPLGGAIGALAFLSKNELLLALVGGVFVVEALSVIVQVASFKTTGRRVFRMAPIHHHFEQQGMSEPKVIVRFWIVSILLALFALMTLKLR